MLLIRRLRGIAITAITWGISWALLGATALVAIDLVTDSPALRPGFGLTYLFGLFGLGLRFFGTIGMMSGALFAVAVALGERRQTFGTLRTGRMIMWGALGGAALPLLVGLGSLATGAQGAPRELVISVIGALLGAGSAWAMMGVARTAAALDSGAASNLERLMRAPARTAELD